MALVTAVLVTVGASLAFETVMVKVCVPVAPAASVTVSVTLWLPTSELVGVPVRTPLLAVKVSQPGMLELASVNVSPASMSVPTAVYV